MPESTSLLLGPVLRRVVDDRATVWVQTAHPATVTVRAGDAVGAARTFTVFDRHYALVVVDGLAADAVTAYQVLLNGEVVWPPPEYPYPAPVIRTRPVDAPVRLVFGSCRQATPATTRGFPPDALDGYAMRLADQVSRRGAAGADWPDCLLLLGDQIYADETSPVTRSWLSRRRTRRIRYDDAPEDQVVDYAEYARLYLESWSDPEIRWLLSCVPAAMIFDDHEVIDDWNTSAAWRQRMATLPWWSSRITAGMASYWVYQHLGNLHPDELGEDPLYPSLVAATDPAEATALLRDFGRRADTDGQKYRWSHSRDIGRTRIVVLDNRAGRVLTPGARAMLPDEHWAWLDRLAHGGEVDHLVIGASLPW